MSIEKSQISNLIIRAVKEIGDEDQNNRLIDANPATELYGLNGNLDSLQLVRLIASVEEGISSKTGKDLSIADERAMSLKSSPFRNIETFTDYVYKLLA